MTYDIIIPHFGVSDELSEKCRACLRSIKLHSANESYRIIFFDNATPHLQFQKIEDSLNEHDHLLISSTENLGFIRAVNLSLEMSTAPYVVLMNNDTEAAPNWLPSLRAPLDTSPNIGLSGPRTTTPKSWQGRIPYKPEWELIGVNSMLAFFCVMIKRQVLEQLGGLDEDFGVGFGDDDMYCLRAHRAGWRMALVSNLLIPHHHRSTFHTLYGVHQTLEMQSQALDKFQEKRRELLTK